MEYAVNLGSISYTLVLMAFGVVGSCYQAYKKRGSTKPFFARSLTGSFAGSITMLFIHYVVQVDEQPILHFGIAALVGVVAEKGEENLVENLFRRKG